MTVVVVLAVLAAQTDSSPDGDPGAPVNPPSRAPKSPGKKAARPPRPAAPRPGQKGSPKRPRVPSDQPAAPPKAHASHAPASLSEQIDQYMAALRKLENRGNTKDAIPVLRKLVEARQQLNGAEHAETAWAIDRLGSTLSRARDPAAEKYLQQALKIRLKLFGERDPITAVSFNNLGLLYSRQKKYQQARELFQRCLDAHVASRGADDPTMAGPLTNLGNLLMAMREYPAARASFERVLQLDQAAHGDASAPVARSFRNLAYVATESGDFKAAQDFYLRALAIEQQLKGKKHPDVAGLFNYLGQVAEKSGDLPAARANYQQALDIRREVQGELHPDTVIIMANLADLLKSEGDFAAARPLYEQVLAFRRKTLGEKHVDTAKALQQLGGLYFALGDSQMAMLYFRHALAISREVSGARSPESAAYLCELGAVCGRLGNDKEAQECLEESLAIYRHLFGERDTRTASALDNLGSFYLRQRDLQKARECWEQALTIRRDILGEEHLATATSLSNVAGILHELKDDASAIPLFQTALQIHRQRQGMSHPDTVIALHNLSAALRRQGDWAAATELGDEARRGTRRHIARVLPGLSENEQITFLRNRDQSHFWSTLTIALDQRNGPEAVDKSAAWVINGKGVAEESLAARALLARETRDPKLAAAAQEMLEVRQKLASLIVAVPLPEEAQKHAEQRRALESREAFLSRTLFQRGSSDPSADPWIELDAVRRRIPRAAVLVNMIRFRRRDLESNDWQSARYVAWVVPSTGEGDVALFDLGEAAPIDEAVWAVRKSLAEASTRSNPAGVDPALAESLAKLSELVYRPLAPAIESAHEWLLSPDGALWLVPWAALPVDEGSYALERHTIRYLTSGRELVSEMEAVDALKSGLALADPDFEADPTSKESIQPNPALATPPTLLAATNGRGAVAGLPARWSRLPGTASELAATLPNLERFLGAPPKTYTGAQATEAIFKETLRPRVVVLSTHGFVLPDEDELADKSATTSLKTKPAQGRITNPLLRCGLVLAGANHASAGDRPAGSDDGILTGLEIVGTDLRGTELVVLSACETGLGELRSGEGVAGLRQAFQLAGARAVVSTLWQIPDQETSWLMTRFWETLATGLDEAEALRDAQLFVLREHSQLVQLAAQGQADDLAQLLVSRGLKSVKAPPKSVQAPAASDEAKPGRGAHPLLWAAFTLTGPPDVAAQPAGQAQGSNE
jgi:CHAT domain-containing protein/tetratricopeptide (TPR) repeat protein